jgi:PAS domain S-box-containing protein
MRQFEARFVVSGPDDVLIIARDITEAQEADLRMRRLSTRHAAILESAADRIFGIDLKGNVTFANPAAERQLGYGTGELVGENSHSLLHHTRADGTPYPAEDCPLARVIATGEPVQARDEVRCPKAGTSFAVEITAAPIIGRGPVVRGAVAIFRDITERKEVDRLKDEFVSLVSHELRTPLTSIKGYVDVLRDGEVGELTAEQDDFLRVVASNTDRLTAIVSDLLDLSRIESGSISLSVGPVDIVDLARSAYEELRGIGQASGITTVFESPGEPLLVSVDEVRTAQVLTNLSSNAHKYSPDGGEIIVRVLPDGPMARIEVEDHGLGIAAADVDRLFTRFFRARGAVQRGIGGTGLGLVIARSLVELQGGSISVLSRLGSGTTFSFTVPLAEPTTEDTLELAGAETPKASGGSADGS